jgi:hypothetical protein
VYKFRDPKTSDQEMLESICGVLMPLKLQAKVSRPMDIIINSLYNNKDIFVWEPISNVSDALERIRILSLTDKEVLVEGDTEKLEIQIQLDKEKKMLSMQDKGIGMTIIANGVQVRPLPWPSFYYYAAWMRWMKSLVMALCWDLFGAGTETTSVTTEWAPSLLLNHPEALKKAQAELDAVVGSSHLITTNDMCCLGYLHCIINETLHMYSAAMLLLPHESMVDCKVDGYDGTLSKDDGLVDGLRKCEQWKWQDIIASKETKTSSWFHEFIGRAKKPEMRCPPFGCGCGWDVVPYKQPWPPPMQFMLLGDGVQVRPMSWPSFYCYAALVRWIKSLVVANILTKHPWLAIDRGSLFKVDCSYSTTGASLQYALQLFLLLGIFRAHAWNCTCPLVTTLKDHNASAMPLTLLI